MRSPPRILIADDSPASLDILRTRLVSQGYEVVTATDGQEAVDATLAHLPDLILLDVMMPKRDGFEVCRLLRADPALPFIPIILVTAKDDSRDIVAGLDSGADEYLTKPVNHAALTARVRSILRTKALHDTVQEQAAQLAEWNRTLERRVAEQLAELERMGRSSASSRPRSPSSSSPAGLSICSTATGATSPWCSATCGASPPSARWPSRRRSCGSSGSTTSPWVP